MIKLNHRINIIFNLKKRILVILIQIDSKFHLQHENFIELLYKQCSIH